MTTQLKIMDENAEPIGRPILDKIIQSFVHEDREEFIQHFPYLQDWMTVEIFDEAVVVLHRLGEPLSIEYSSRSIERDKHRLHWKVQHRNDESPVNWEMFLDDSQEEIQLKGFRFDR